MVSLLKSLCTCFLPLKCHVELLVAVHDCVLCVVIISALFSPRPALQYVLITILCTSVLVSGPRVTWLATLHVCMVPIATRFTSLTS